MAFVAAIAFLAFGCSNVDIIGQYKIEVDSSAMKEEDRAQAEFASAMLSMFRFEFKPDNKCVMTAMGQPTEGTYSLQGGTLTISLPGSTGNSVPKSFKVLEGGRRLEPVVTEKEKADMNGLKVYLVRVSQNPEKPTK